MDQPTPEIVHETQSSSQIETSTTSVNKVNITSKRKPAPCWSHSEKVKRRNEKGEIIDVVAICNYCQKEFKADGQKHGNSGINNHLKRCKLNPENAAKIDSSQPSITQSSLNNMLVPHLFNQKRLENKVAEFIVRDEMAFRVVEGVGFVALMKEAQPRFKIPNRKKVALLVWDLYAMEMAKIKSMIGDQTISITTDTWTSIQNINYMVITAHFLDNDWNLHKRVINFTKITSHKGEDIGKVLESCLNGWEIDKVFTITVDNASSNDKAIEYMEKSLKDLGTLMFDGKYLHLRCTCHIINLIVKSGLKKLDKEIAAIRNCVKYIHSSPSRLDQFRECAVRLKMDKMSIVPMDVPTRWNSTYSMLSVAYKFKNVFSRMMENPQFVDYFEEMECSSNKGIRSKRVGPPIIADWDKSQAFVYFLERFYRTTLQLSASKTVTSSLVWEEIVSIETSINAALHDESNSVLQEVAKNMKDKFNKYWGDVEKINKLIFLGHVLDPCYKFQMIYIQLEEMGFDSEKIQRVVKGVKDCLMVMYNANKDNSSSGPVNGDNDGDVDKDLVDRIKNDPIKLKSYLKMAQLRKPQNQAEITNEVDKYLSDPFVKLSLDFDIVKLWKGNTTTFPVLSKIAKIIFAIPSSTVASENSFSLGRRIVDPFRASLNPKMVEALVCTSDWLRGEEINFYKEPTEEEIEFYKDCEEVVTTNERVTGPRPQS